MDVFYVTDLLGDKISSPTRQAAIKRALLALFAGGAQGDQALAQKRRGSQLNPPVLRGLAIG